MSDPRNLKSDYMHFAKYGAGATHVLSSSGVKDAAWDDVGWTLDDLALHGPNAGGFMPLRETIAARFGIGAECVTTPGGGCSFANHLALAALVSPGDEVLVETPTYELLVDQLGYLQADIRRFERRAEEGWRLDPEAVAAAITPNTRLVVLTNLHNPTSALASPTEVAAVAEAAAQVGARVMVDEVYLELMFRDGRAFTSFRPEGNVIVTASLTKAYGLTGLRCGWILAPAPLAERMSRLNDLYGVHAPHVSERMAVTAFARLARLRDRATALIDANRAAYRELLGDHPALEQTLFDQGATVFPRIVTGEDGDQLFARLRSDYDTSLVPGRFFGAPDHVRIGLVGEPAMTREGLTRLAEALAR
jgi:aspartate/methionine/tyrosine aminotransferase